MLLTESIKITHPTRQNNLNAYISNTLRLFEYSYKVIPDEG